ncbi:YqcI/YcgG family protein [Roseibium sp. CAU 1637]|uniref:YqcI/YcgG family protein n=1 Tax=Roseibium limicola TaxID=2816037 RepID=A0A939ENX3_9HYPH|nr:guanitoxin biosynthesis heme-dependent pre-guanitoxin N-hydroxylase GntA [Roseibium limicola]MBO0346004.1 YqcI/YcgG family protein [Roseibium limicola]
MTVDDLKLHFEQFVKSEEFPCVGAKSALARGTMEFLVVEAIDTAVTDLDIYKAVHSFAQRLDLDSPVLQTLVVLFRQRDALSEAAYEEAMWDRIQCLHNIDVAAGENWNKGVDPDPEAKHFSLSLAGEAFFVVGLHPNSSRPARRFDHPVMVFNSHRQFEGLRADGRFDKMKEIIRARDTALAGDINPMLDDYGNSSEARQYSGRAVDSSWKCPFQYKEISL